VAALGGPSPPYIKQSGMRYPSVRNIIGPAHPLCTFALDQFTRQQIEPASAIVAHGQLTQPLQNAQRRDFAHRARRRPDRRQAGQPAANGSAAVGTKRHGCSPSPRSTAIQPSPLNAFLKRHGHHVAGWRQPQAALKADPFSQYRQLALTARPAGLDPLPTLAALAAITTHTGLIVTTATSTYHGPYHVARKFASLDSISGGRAGWNLVTSDNPGEAANFGRSEHSGSLDAWVVWVTPGVVAALLKTLAATGAWANRQPDQVATLIAASQQQVADLFYDLKLIPKKVDVNSKVWRWQP